MIKNSDLIIKWLQFTKSYEKTRTTIANISPGSTVFQKIVKPLLNQVINYGKHAEGVPLVNRYNRIQHDLGFERSIYSGACDNGWHNLGGFCIST